MTSPSDCGWPNHQKCTGCDGEVMVGRFEPIALPRVDESGNRLIDPDTGEMLTVVVKLPVHINPHYHSVMDDTGLVPAGCDHGLPHHPNPAVEASLGRLARTWIRSKYLLVGPGMTGKCVVCIGNPRPADLVTPRGEKVPA